MVFLVGGVQSIGAQEGQRFKRNVHEDAGDRATSPSFRVSAVRSPAAAAAAALAEQLGESKAIKN